MVLGSHIDPWHPVHQLTQQPATNQSLWAKNATTQCSGPQHSNISRPYALSQQRRADRLNMGSSFPHLVTSFLSQISTSCENLTLEILASGSRFMRSTYVCYSVTMYSMCMQHFSVSPGDTIHVCRVISARLLLLCLLLLLLQGPLWHLHWHLHFLASWVSRLPLSLTQRHTVQCTLRRIYARQTGLNRDGLWDVWTESPPSYFSIFISCSHAVLSPLLDSLP